MQMKYCRNKRVVRLPTKAVRGTREVVMNEKKCQIITEPGTRIVTPDQFTWLKYQKRPIIVSATKMEVPFKVETLEGWSQGQPGDWLIEGACGEFYPCNNEVFQATYETVGD